LGSTINFHERQGLGSAMNYVQRVKTRFSNDPDTYKQFLEILASHKSSANNAEVFAKVEELFKDAPDLSSAFRDFLRGAGSAPDADGLGTLRGSSTRMGTPSGEYTRAQKWKQPADPAPDSASYPAKGRRKAADRDKEKERDAGRTSGSRTKQHPTGREPWFSHFSTILAPSRRRSGHSYLHQAPPPVASQNFSRQGFMNRARHLVDSIGNLISWALKICPFTQRVKVAFQEVGVDVTRYEKDLPTKPEWYVSSIESKPYE